jgi:ABC-type sulfate/molybdate transport systems ATPase subunit
VAQALSMMRLIGPADRRTQQLSGGQQQRVAVARGSCSSRGSFFLTSRWARSTGN